MLQMSRKRTYSPVYERVPKRMRFASSERLVTPEESTARGLLPDRKVSANRVRACSHKGGF